MIYQGKIFGVRQDRVIEPGGVNALRDVVTHNGSVVILPVLRRRYFARAPVSPHRRRFSVGACPRGAWSAAKNRQWPHHRELEEETSYRAKHLKLMMDVYPTPGFVEERMFVYAATDCARANHSRR